jgi:hypothetical protein
MTNGCNLRLSGQKPTRPVRLDAGRASGELRCTICGSADQVEKHHVGGRNHVVWFTIPLCRDHHVRLTAYIAAAGVDMRYSPDRLARLRRARQAICMLLWFLDMEEEEFTSQSNNKSKGLNT